MSAPRGRWLQRELLRRLMLPVLGIVVLSGVLTGFNAHALVGQVFDRWLLDTAWSLATQVQFRDGQAVAALTPQADTILTYDIIDRVTYEVLQGGRHVLGARGLPLHGGEDRSYRPGAHAYDSQFDGRPVRVALVAVTGPHGERATVLVSETRAKRQAAERALVLVFAPVALLVVLAAIVLGVGVRRTIRPLESMAAQWNERSHVSLDPVPTQDVPRELMPFALALNDLLGRVRDLMLRERRLAATAAHQLRTPLAGLQLGLARAAECPDLPSTRAALAELGAVTQRTARMVQQLLALSRLDPDVRDIIELEDVDLVKLARDVGEAYMDAAQARHIELELESPEHPVVIRGQPDLLSEALGNLIDNAVRYTPAGGRVALGVATEPPTLTVSDSGPGIGAEDGARVFQPYVRGRGTLGAGSGLGLAIVKEIASLHHADVDLGRSEALGGTRFALCFRGEAAWN